MEEKYIQMLVEAVQSCKSAHKRLDKVEKNIEEIKNLTIAVKEIAMETKATREDVNDMNSRLKEVEEKPAKNWDNLIKTIITRNSNSYFGLFFSEIYIGGIYMKKKILIAIAFLLAVVGVFCGIYFPQSDLNNTLDTAQNTIEKIENIEENEVVLTDEMKEKVNETIENVENGEDISTTEIIESSEEEEQEITDEGALENDAIVEQENIEYNGDSTGNGLSLLGTYQGLTYYSQADSRWANILYTSTGNTSQTMKSSACGPTSAAMVVSSSKGAILPTTMAQLAVANGYRTANSGTAWSYYSFVADYFGFNEYYSTGNFDKAMNYLSQKNRDGSSKYYIIASCGSGLFTSGGHYIVLVANTEGTITVYDPYLYSRKV